MTKLTTKRFAATFFKGLCIYSMILWAWIAVNYYVYPAYQTGPLTLYLPVPQNLVATVAFPLSFASYVVWQYLEKESV